MRKVVVKDDLDHNIDADETIEFTVDGVTYTLDLCKANAAKFRTALKKWLEAAHDQRKVKSNPQKKGDAAQAERRKAIREWGKANGYVINRGQLSRAVIAAYEAANG